MDINKKELLVIYPQYEKDVNYLCEHYKTYSAQYDEAVEIYNKIIKGVKQWNESTSSKKIYNQSERWVSKIESINYDLNNSKINIKKLKTYKLDRDFLVVRSDFIQAVDELLSKISDIKSRLEEINDCSGKIIGNSNTMNTDELDEILSQIYLLDVDEQENIEELVDKISDFAISAFKGDSSNSETIENIVSIKNELNDYSDYITLKKIY